MATHEPWQVAHNDSARVSTCPKPGDVDTTTGDEYTIPDVPDTD
jgi:hypothetical protein